MPAQAKNPPSSFEDLIARIHEDYDDLSKTNKQIAVYVTQNPNDVAINAVNAIAEVQGIHASSFVRFAQHFGFKGFKPLQAVFRQRLTTAAPGFEARAQQMKSGLVQGDAKGLKAHLVDLVANDLASLEQLLIDVEDEQLQQAIGILADSDTIYLIGQLRSEPIVTLMRYILTMLGRRTVLLDPSGGLATQMANVATTRDAMIAVSFRYYAKEVVNVVEDLSKRGVPIIGITDSTLSPLAKNADVTFAVPERATEFSRSLAAPICLAQALMVGLAARLNDDDTIRPTIRVVTTP
ncbi:MAG: MurR/RpiR family transcriptional regulator [Rhodobacterales bacterium]|jgi:DNA-binding MurR/RpiR family transcriptional regulator|tara:strand:+ start:289 stop:1170 length:882 start_codon:yes stop_codon:yes gene_type:complete